MKTLFSIAGIDVHEYEDGSLSWLAAMTIDADGAYRAYSPENHGLDDLANARDGRGGWAGLVLDEHGRPVIQGAADPAPGYYVSPTAYTFTGFAPRDPRRYVESASVPYIVVPPQIRLAPAGIVLGCRAEVTHQGSGIKTAAVVADIGPRRKLGEASIACARALGIPSSARTGGEDRRCILYRIWPGQPAVVNGVTFPLQKA